MSNTLFKTQITESHLIFSKAMSTSTGAGVELSKFLTFLNNFAPENTAESWDNVGLLVEPYGYSKVRKVILTNDLTEKVMDEAISLEANFILTYHPLIFAGLKRITQNDWKARIISRCFDKGFAVYSPHTAWDAAENGVNKWLIEAVSKNYVDLKPITPNASNQNLGAGKMCSLVDPITIEQAIINIKNFSGLRHVHLGMAKNAHMNTQIKSIAVCAGSGASVLKNAVADLYITGEMSHHDVLDATHKGTTCFLLNHSNSERYFLGCFKTVVEQELPGLPVLVSEVDEDPIVTV